MTMVNAERLEEMADRLIRHLLPGTPWEVALRALEEAYITGDAVSGEDVLKGRYSDEESLSILELLESAASAWRG